MTYLANAFALSMVEPGIDHALVELDRLDLDEAREALADGFTSAVGHADVAAMVGQQLGLAVLANRVNVVLHEGDALVVAQYGGPRLPEGTRELPAGARLDYWLVRVRVPALPI